MLLVCVFFSVVGSKLLGLRLKFLLSYYVSDLYNASSSHPECPLTCVEISLSCDL